MKKKNSCRVRIWKSCMNIWAPFLFTLLLYRQIRERFKRKVRTVFPSATDGNSTKKNSNVNLGNFVMWTQLNWSFVTSLNWKKKTHTLAYRSFPQIKGVHRNDPPIYHGRWWSAATFLFFVSSWQLCLRGNMKTRLKRFRFARISQKWFNQRRGLLRRLSKIHASGVMGFRSPLHLANVWNNVSSDRLKQLALS